MNFNVYDYDLWAAAMMMSTDYFQFSEINFALDQKALFKYTDTISKLQWLPKFCLSKHLQQMP